MIIAMPPSSQQPIPHKVNRLSDFFRTDPSCMFIQRTKTALPPAPIAAPSTSYPLFHISTPLPTNLIAESQTPCGNIQSYNYTGIQMKMITDLNLEDDLLTFDD